MPEGDIETGPNGLFEATLNFQTGPASATRNVWSLESGRWLRQGEVLVLPDLEVETD